MKRKLLLRTEPCQGPEEYEGNAVVAASQAVYIDDRRILNIDLFWHGTLRARYFADEELDEYGAFIGEGCGRHNGWTKMSLGNTARAVMGKETVSYIYRSDDIVWASAEDKRRVYSILDTYSLEAWEASVNRRKYTEAMEWKADRINRLMDSIPPVPKGVKEWVEDEIFPEQFLLVTKKEKCYTYICTHCGAKGWKKAGWKHNEMTACPKCGHKVRANRRKEIIEKKTG